MSKNYKTKVLSFALRCFAFLFLFAFSQSGYSQGLACNAGVNVSLDQNCLAVINAKHILKGEPIDADPLDYIVEILKMDGTQPDSLDVEFSNTAISSTNPVVAAAFAATFEYGNKGSYVRFMGSGHYKVSITRKSDGVPCWGDLLIEDKLPPFTTECFCPEDSPFNPVDCIFSCATVTNFMNNDSIAKLAGVSPMFMDHCGSVANVEFDDVLTQDTACGNWIITRTWRTIVSNHGRLEYKNLNCTQRFLFQSFGADAISPPKKKVVVTCGTATDPESLRNHFSNTTLFPGTNPDSAIACSYPYLVDSINATIRLIHAIGQGLTPGTNDDLCKITATYTDTQKQPICGDIGYKFVRSWHVIDWCTNQSLPEFYQVIKVVDEEAPHFTIPDSIPAGMTDPWTCQGEIMVPAPDTLYDNCSSLSQITWIAYVLDGSNRIEANAANGFKLNGLKPGTYEIIYVVTDLCDNESIDKAVLVIKDEVDPVALSKYEIRVTFSSYLGNCTAKIHPNSVDAGSFDACSDIVKYEIRRMDGGTFGPFVKFDQGDINSVNDAGVAFGYVNVELRVMDAHGNSNLAWTKVRLEDKNTQLITDCGARTIRITCKDDLDAAIASNAPTVIIKACVDSNLTVVPMRRSSNLDNRCNTGSVVVDYKIIGSSDTICSKTFIVGDIDSLRIKWPTETIEVSCTDTDFGEVEITGKDCNSIAPTERFIEVDVTGSGYCKKLIREITIIDWCLYQVNTGDTIGIYKYNQIIKVKDDDAPVVTCENIEMSAGDNCELQGLQLTAMATDASVCPNETIRWEAAIDTDRNGSFDLVLNPVADAQGGARAIVTTPLSIGVYNVKWTAIDDCGNPGTQICTITITDGKAPTPQCITSVSTVIMNTSGSVGIWAKDFDLDAKSTDCGGTLTYSFSGTDRNVPVKTYTCSDLPDGITLIDTFRVYVWDAAGNRDFCTVMLRIDDNSDVCPDTNIGSAAISGSITTAQGSSLESAEVFVSTTSNDDTNMKMTDVDGKYAFTNTPMSRDYALNAEKNDDYLNGITTIDIILMQRHILSIKTFEEAYQTIAADVSGDERVSSLDLVEMRKLILGISSDFSAKKSWRFISTEQELTDVRDPWPLDESLHIDYLDHNQSDQNFIAIKMGDVSGDAIANSALIAGGRSYDDEVLLINDRTISKGEEVSISLDLSNVKDVYGFQLSMALKGGHWINAASDEVSLDDDNLFVTDDHMRISWNDIKGSLDGGKLNVTFIADRSGTLSDMISLDKEDVLAQAYSSEDLDVTNFHLSWTTSSDDLNNDFELYQNIPNPFEGQTTISFRIAKQGRVELAIFDMTGRQVLGQSGVFDAGLNKIMINQEELNQSGVLYYQLSYDNKIATRKMLSIE